MPKFSFVRLGKVLILCLSFYIAFFTVPVFADQFSISSSPSNSPTTVSSAAYNWAGYVVSSVSLYTGVSGTWTVPKIAQGSSAGADATWIGIGGLASSDLIQAGTQSITDRGCFIDDFSQ